MKQWWLLNISSSKHVYADQIFNSSNTFKLISQSARYFLWFELLLFATPRVSFHGRCHSALTTAGKREEKTSQLGFWDCLIRGREFKWPRYAICCPTVECEVSPSNSPVSVYFSARNDRQCTRWSLFCWHFWCSAPVRVRKSFSGWICRFWMLFLARQGFMGGKQDWGHVGE